MEKFLLRFMVLGLGINLTACSLMPSYFTNNSSSANPPAAPKPVPHVSQNPATSTNGAAVQTANGTLGGSIANSMDVIDKNKMSHALDNSFNKATQWTNANTGITYTVVPIAKVTIQGYQFCRRYTVTSVKNKVQHQVTGTACVGSTDNNWHNV